MLRIENLKLPPGSGDATPGAIDMSNPSISMVR